MIREHGPAASQSKCHWMGRSSVGGRGADGASACVLEGGVAGMGTAALARDECIEAIWLLIACIEGQRFSEVLQKFKPIGNRPHWIHSSRRRLRLRWPTCCVASGFVRLFGGGETFRMELMFEAKHCCKMRFVIDEDRITLVNLPRRYTSVLEIFLCIDHRGDSHCTLFSPPCMVCKRLHFDLLMRFCVLFELLLN